MSAYDMGGDPLTLGIDPGKQGALAFLGPDGDLRHIEDMPPHSGAGLGDAVRALLGDLSPDYVAEAWVEVRAPRPTAATERVQAWEAVRDGRQVVGASSPFEAHYIWRSGPNRAFIGERTMDKAVLVAPDGTVEVLRRDGES